MKRQMDGVIVGAQVREPFVSLSLQLGRAEGSTRVDLGNPNQAGAEERIRADEPGCGSALGQLKGGFGGMARLSHS